MSVVQLKPRLHALNVKRHGVQDAKFTVSSMERWIPILLTEEKYVVPAGLNTDAQMSYVSEDRGVPTKRLCLWNT